MTAKSATNGNQNAGVVLGVRRMLFIAVTAVLVFQQSAVSLAATQDSLPLSDSIAPKTTASDYQFRATRLILPASLITVGAIGVANDWFYNAKSGVRNGLEDWLGSERELRIDDGLQYLPAAAFIGLDYLGVKAKHPLRERIAIAVTSYAAMTTTVKTTKWCIDEERPDSHKDNSFPSGHTATSFTGAELIRIEYGPVAGGCAYALATGIAFMRLYNDRHWLNDVIGGAGFGILSARIGFWLLPVERRIFKWDQSTATTAVVPVYNPADNSFGLAMTVVF